MDKIKLFLEAAWMTVTDSLRDFTGDLVENPGKYKWLGWVLLCVLCFCLGGCLL